MQQEFPFSRSDEFDELLAKKPISDRARDFLVLMFTAANGKPPAGITGSIVRRTEFVMTADQIALAAALGLSADAKPESRTRAIRRLCGELEALGGCFRRFKFDDVDAAGCPVKSTGYWLDIAELLDVPDGERESSHGRAVLSVLKSSPAAVSGAVSGGSSGAVSGSLVPVLSCTPETESKSVILAQEQERTERRDFSSSGSAAGAFQTISVEHCRAIAGYGSVRPIERLQLFFSVFEDAHKAGFVAADEAELFAAVISTAAERCGPSAPAGRELRSPCGWIRTVWKSRHERSPELTTRARQMAAGLIELSSQLADRSSVARLIVGQVTA